MSAFILAKKFKMTQIWRENRVIPVTLVKAVGGNQVTLERTTEKDGYTAVQIALGKTKREFKGAGLPKAGDIITVEQFQPGDMVRVSGLTKGRGFQGVVKRHGFAGGPKTHGQKNRFRAPGSIGATAPQRVVPGRKMAGHMGVERVTIKNLEVIEVDKENGVIALKGAVPGYSGTLLEVVKK